MVSGTRPRVLMIGLDAAEPSLIEAWTGDGTLRHIQHLMERGVYSRLGSTADWLSGSPWPTFYTGTTPAEHGQYNYLPWHPELMAATRPAPDRYPLRHFYRELSRLGPRVVAIDVPRSLLTESLNGVEISGWGTSEAIAQGSYPTSVWERLTATFGPPPDRAEKYGQLPPRLLLQTAEDERGGAERVTAVALSLMEDEAWDFFLVCFEATHRGGHKLWDETGTTDSSGPEIRERVRRALRDVYVAVDEAVGRLVAAAGEDTVTVVFSVHGMGPNISRAHLLGEMLDRVLSSDGEGVVKSRRVRGIDRLRGSVPVRWRVSGKRRLPLSWQDRLTGFWEFGGVDWSRTRAFSLVADLQGYVRVNLRGREAAGIVEPGPELNDLCSRIQEGLSSFVDVDTGIPIVERALRSRDLYPSGERVDHLPDVIVKWSAIPAAHHRGIAAPDFGSIPWPTPGRNPSGRSGNHRPEGFVLATGRMFPARRGFLRAHVMDLAPTVFDLFGFPVPEWMGGSVLMSKIAADGSPAPPRD